MNNPIGGYFELEINKGGHYHKNAVRLNTACNCFEYVLRARRYSKMYIPYYTCDVMLKPLMKLDIKYEFYHINKLLELLDMPVLNKGTGILYTNYFGLKQNYVKHLAEVYGNKLIVDNAQAFYAEPISGIDTFYSARKFFGVPDGAYLYTDKPLQQEFEQDCSFDRMAHLLKRIDLGAEAGYQDFRMNDDSLIGQDIKRMSKLTENLLCGIDYESARKVRRSNYLFLDNELSASNLFHLELDDAAVPMVYPFLTNDKELKKRLISVKVFVATYWPNVFEWCRDGDLEYQLTQCVCYLPIDQRYNDNEMHRIIETINK